MSRNKKIKKRKNSENNYESTPEHIRNLVEEIKKEDALSVCSLISYYKAYDVDFNLNYIDGAPPIIHAVETQNIEIVKSLLDNASINLNNLDGYNRTALNVTIENNDIEIAELLIQRGAQPNKEELKGRYSDSDLESKTLTFIREYKERVSILHKKLQVNTKAICACSILTLIFSRTSISGKSTFQKIPLELNVLIAEFLIGNDPIKHEKENESKLSWGFGPHMCLYNFTNRTYDMRKMPFFSFFMQEQFNIIDINYIKLNLRLAWKAMLGIENIVSKNHEDYDLEFDTDYSNFISKYFSLNTRKKLS